MPELPTKLKIKVTQQHIDNGIMDDASFCPIALAVCELLKLDAAEIEVDCDHIIIADVAGYDLPDVAREFIRGYDADEECKPFEFETEECIHFENTSS